MTLALKEKAWEHVFSDGDDWSPSTTNDSSELPVHRLALDAEGARRIFVSAPSSVDSEVRPGLRRRRRVNRLGRVRRTDQHATAQPAPLGAGAPSTVGVAIEGTPLPYRVSVATIADLATKRTVDICGSLFGLVVLAPLMILVAWLIRLTSRGPAIYAHTRVGQGGEEFVCYKFRTMVADAEAKKSELAHLNAHDDDRTFKMRNDPRITRIGKYLRMASVDELPQLVNVLLGDMSLVGPRPALPNEVALYSSRDRLRLAVKPGLTCIWQVSGRSKLAFPEQVRLDLEYVERRSLWLDLQLIARTIPAVFCTDGAY